MSGRFNVRVRGATTSGLPHEETVHMAHAATMRAVVISEPGGPDVLTIEERPVPVLDDGEILVAVAAAGVNRADVMQRKGLYPPPPGASDLPGLEISGVVARVGRGVDRFKE